VTAKEYLEIFHNTFLWRNIRSFEKNSLKKVQKMPKGYFRDTGIHHRLLKIDTVDNLLLHPAAGASFEAYVIEEIIRGFHCTMASGIDFYYYRTRDRSEIDLVIDAPFGLIPIEIKLGHKVNLRMLTALRNFMHDTQAGLGILVNNADKIEPLTDTIIQIPARYL
jgi:predicted AAA+ superfamily ATPase